jgi:hypothetical protein
MSLSSVPIISRTRHPRADPCLAGLPRYVASNVRNSFLRTRSVAWDLRHITSLELATVQSNGQMFDFARTTTNIAQTPTSPAAFLTVT